METRVEIYKDERWQALTLAKDAKIKYNSVINKIGKVASREISHTNTFSLPNIHHNRQALGINVFNPLELSKALNSKYLANYYVEDKILQHGYLVINNTTGGTIKVNFIDESLSLTAKWGSTTFKELLQDDLIEFPADYAASIAELRDYDLDKNAVLTPLTEVGTRGFNLCIFPNNLNAIGENFQKDDDDLRIDDAFNPYQSRPIFSAKGLLDLATTGFGYTPIYDDSVEWDIVEDTYIINSGQQKNKKGENGIQTNRLPSMSSNGPYSTTISGGGIGASWKQTKTLFLFPTTNSLKPNDIPGWTDPSWLVYANPYFGSNPGAKPWMSQNCVFTPDVAAGNVGTIRLIADWPGDGSLEQYGVHTIWKNATPGGDVIHNFTAIPDIANPPTQISFDAEFQVDITIDKVLWDIIPAGTDGVIGAMVYYGRSFQSLGLGLMTNMITTETYLPEGVVAFDESGQFLPDTADLAYAAPTESLKTLISGLMHQQGILMDINAQAKTVKFFNYGEYEAQRNEGNFKDWSKYLRKYSPFIHNTDYGKQYAKKNRIGLSDPYPGNTFDINLENQGEDSKYKDFTTNYVSKFKDIENVQQANNTVTPYFEYTNKGLGLVELSGTLGTLSQQRADSTVQGNFTGLAAIANVNYARIPDGVKWWYGLVDEAIRVEAIFLLPVDEVKNIDLSEPIYVEELGGFYIIEEIKEYTNGQTPVMVKLIKLLDDLRGIVEYEQNLVPRISLIASSAVATPPSSYVDIIASNTSFFDYTPTGVSTVTYKKLTQSIDTGGVYTGAVISHNFTPASPYTEIVHTVAASLPITTLEEGWYEVEVTDPTQGLVSNKDYAYLGDNSVGIKSITFIPDVNNAAGNPSGTVDIYYSYNNFSTPPTHATYVFRKYNYTTGSPAGVLRIGTWPSSPLSGTVTHTLLDGPGYYQMHIETNDGTVSPTPVIGGFFIL